MTKQNQRPAFSAMEITTALAVLAIAGMLIAQLATGLLAHRTAQENHEHALTVAENMLEIAKTIEAKELSNWAARQVLPVALQTRWPQGKLTITVEKEKALPLRRITVTIALNAESAAAAPLVTLSAWFAEESP